MLLCALVVFVNDRQRIALNAVAVCRDCKAGLTITVTTVKAGSCLFVSLRNNNVIVIEAGVGNTARRRKLFTVTVKDPRKVVVSGNVHIRTRIVLTILVFIRVQFGHIRFVKRNGCITTDKVGVRAFLKDSHFQILVYNWTRIDIIRIAAATAGRRNIQQSQRRSLEGITGLGDGLDFNTDITPTFVIGEFITGLARRCGQLRFTATRIIAVAVPFDSRRRFRINTVWTIVDIPFGIADIPPLRDGIS